MLMILGSCKLAVKGTTSMADAAAPSVPSLVTSTMALCLKKFLNPALFSFSSGLLVLFFKFLHAGDYFPLLHKGVQNHKFSNKNNYLPAWRDFKIFFSRPLFTIIFRPKMVFLDTGSILRVKSMYESVK
jgi:hypothetical protein